MQVVGNVNRRPHAVIMASVHRDAPTLAGVALAPGITGNRSVVRAESTGGADALIEALAGTSIGITCNRCKLARQSRLAGQLTNLGRPVIGLGLRETDVSSGQRGWYEHEAHTS